MEMKRLKSLLVMVTVAVSVIFSAGCSSADSRHGGQTACRCDNANTLAATPKQADKAALSAALSRIAADNADGFTVDAVTLKPVTKGYAVSLAATQNSFGTEGLARVIDYVTSHDGVNAYGGWFNPDNGRYYYDATVICDTHEEAATLARLNNQIAYFDLENMREIRL